MAYGRSVIVFRVSLHLAELRPRARLHETSPHCCSAVWPCQALAVLNFVKIRSACHSTSSVSTDTGLLAAQYIGTAHEVENACESYQQ
jgi:hypothetical protein